MTRRILFMVPLFVCSAGSIWAQGRENPLAREKVLADAARLLQGGDGVAKVAVSKDPFNPPPADLRDAVAGAKEGEATARNPAELVGLLVERIQPTGSMMLGGEPYLLFTERRQKIGDKIGVSLEGVEYSVEIVNITNNRFRIRYQDKEAERTIK